jgi:hypothetical protein
MTTGVANRRSFLLALPQGAVALTAACAFGSARASHPATPKPTDATATSLVGTRSDPPPDDPAAQERAATPRRVQPLPLPAADDQMCLQEWLDLLGFPSRQAATGC